jgi:hypothetical protein
VTRHTNLVPIYPGYPERIMPKACGCGNDVSSATGFADTSKEFGAYVCLRCAKLTLTFNEIYKRQLERDQRQLREKGTEGWY